jgi:gas vesicle protein
LWRRKMSRSKNTFFAFIFSGFVGIILGFLYAPKSGKETRKVIRDFSDKVTNKIRNLNYDFKEIGSKICKKGCEEILSKKNKTDEKFYKCD